MVTLRMLFGLVDLNFDDFSARSSCSTIRGHNYNYFLRYSCLNIRKPFFSESVVAVWNNLKYNVIDYVFNASDICRLLRNANRYSTLGCLV